MRVVATQHENAVIMFMCLARVGLDKWPLSLHSCGSGWVSTGLLRVCFYSLPFFFTVCLTVLLYITYCTVSSTQESLIQTVLPTVFNQSSTFVSFVSKPQTPQSAFLSLINSSIDIESLEIVRNYDTVFEVVGHTSYLFAFYIDLIHTPIGSFAPLISSEADIRLKDIQIFHTSPFTDLSTILSEGIYQLAAN